MNILKAPASVMLRAMLSPTVRTSPVYSGLSITGFSL